MTKAGITWDKSLIQLRAGDGDANGNGAPGIGGCSAGASPQPSDAPWAVYAVTDVPEGRVLATIPRHAVLSAANSGLSDILAAEKLGGGLALVAAVMYEAARGPQSKWYGYLSSLPPREYLPVFWSEEQLQQLEGTDIADRAHTDREAMAADFETELAPLRGRYPARLGPLGGGWNLEAFMRAASWVASRAFYVDEHHGDALVPLADVFNHKAARVDLRGRGGGGGGWAEGFEVAEHADARLRQQRSGGSDSRKRPGGHRQGRGAAGDDEDDDDDEDDGDDGEEGEDSEEGEEGEDGGEDEDEDEDEGGGEQEGSSSADSDGGDGEGEEQGEGEEGEEEEGEEDEEGSSGRRGKAKAGRRRRVGIDLELDREPGDDGSEPWPSPPPPPPPPPPEETRAGGDGTVKGPGGGGGGVLGGRWGLLAEEAVARGGQNLHLDIGICAGERGGCELLDIVAAQPLVAGAEVFNTYGEHGNDELVNKYGFALPYNPFDEVSLDKGAVVAAARAELGRVAALARVRVLEKQSELLAEDEEPFLLLPPRHVNTSLYVALRLLAEGGSLEDTLAPLRAAWQRERQQQQRQQPSAPPSSQPGLRAMEGAEEKRLSAEEEEDGGSGKGKRRRGSGGAGTEAGGAAGGGAGGGEGGASEGGDVGQRPRKRGRGGAAAAAAGAAPAGAKAGARQDADPDPDASGSGSGSSGAEDSDDGGGGGDGEGSDDDDLPEDVEIQPGSKIGSESGSEQDRGAKAGKAGKPGRGAAAGRRGEGPGGGAGGERDAAAAQPLWTDGMRALLRRVVSERLAAYPTTLEQDERELRNPSAAAGHEGGKEEEEKEKEKKIGKKGKSGGAEAAVDGEMGGCGGGGTPAEAVAARRCALLLRMGEKRLLAQALAHLS